MKQRTTTMTQTQTALYDWVPDLPDGRDILYNTSPAKLWSLPDKTDLSSGCYPVHNSQLTRNSTINAVGAAIDFGLRKQAPAPGSRPSKQFIYKASVLEEELDSNYSPAIRSCIKSINRQTDRLKALTHYELTYRRIRKDLNYLRACLAEGFPFVFGFSAYEELESSTVAQTGRLNMPTRGESFQGGHAVLCVGYDDKTRRFLLRNCWGTDWGKKGYFTIPYEYIEEIGLADDFWKIEVTKK